MFNRIMYDDLYYHDIAKELVWVHIYNLLSDALNSTSTVLMWIVYSYVVFSFVW